VCVCTIFFLSYTVLYTNVLLLLLLYIIRELVPRLTCACVRACSARAADVRHHENLRARANGCVCVCVYIQESGMRSRCIGITLWLMVKNAMLYRVQVDGVLPHRIPL